MKFSIKLVFIALLSLLTIYAITAQWVPILDDTNLIFHEAGHVIFMFFGETMTIAGGSLFQILLPLFISIAFLQKSDFFSFSIMTWWAGENMIGVGRYIADARTQALPLIGGDHDWAVLLSAYPKLLPYDTLIGLIVRDTGIFIMVASIAFTIVILYYQLMNKNNHCGIL